MTYICNYSFFIKRSNLLNKGGILSARGAMKRTQNKTICCLTTAFLLTGMLVGSGVRAQTLPTDPWATAPTVNNVQTSATNTNVMQVQQVGPVVYGSQPYQPTYEGGSSNIWNTKMPEFTGEMTTWGKDYGQRATAPEVNMHNILAITQHLRNMGYQIPTTFEDRVKAAPGAVRDRIFKAMQDLERQNDPFSKGAKLVLDQFETETGLSYDNLIGNSLNLISSK